jgi:glutathione synthase/RimK-type ligase-like ATP-grasp enzyme
MTKKIKIGLWLPPRKDISQSITLENPAHIDVRIYELFLEYLETQKHIEYIENLDFRNAILKNNQVFIGDFCLSELDHFVWMGMTDRTYDSYHLEVLRVLSLSVKVHNSYDFFNLATDKFSAFSVLHQYGLPLPELYLVNNQNLHLLKPKFENASYLLKPRRSSFGIGIVKIDSYEQFRDIAEYYHQKHFYLERFYENDLTQWTGVTAFNGHVLYGYRKQSSKISGWKVYDKDSVGGEADIVIPNEEIKAMTQKVGKVLQGNYFGLDFIKTNSGYKIVDINCSPGIYWRFVQTLKIPVAKYFFEMLAVNS